MSELAGIHTTITDNYLKLRLFKGCILALTGLIALVLSGAFLPEPILQAWGWVIYFTAFFLITLGLLPYRKISRLQNKPNEIRISEDYRFEFWSKNRCILSFPCDLIDKLDFVESKKNYGIHVHLNQKPIVPIKNLKQFHVIVDKDNQVDFTFLYFSKRSCQELYEQLEVPFKDD